jgi:hypothetical protein
VTLTYDFLNFFLVLKDVHGMELINMYALVMKMEIKKLATNHFCVEKRGGWSPVSHYRGMASTR